jgi:hypothetical protein
MQPGDSNSHFGQSEITNPHFNMSVFLNIGQNENWLLPKRFLLAQFSEIEHTEAAILDCPAR